MSFMDIALSGLSLGGQPSVYHTVNISGNAQAILGNVVSDNFSFQHGSNIEWKNTLKALYFEGMRTRKAQITQRAGSPEYVRWIWKTVFADWLGNDESFFWITGRAGSGKSTLMKHIADSRKTKQYLERQGGKWAVVHFFFDFRAGHTTANNLEGMLRSVLYQLVQRCPELAENIDCMSHDKFLALDVVSCLEHVCQVADAASFRICAFIDGLDEYEGSGAELVETIRSLEDRAGFKLCLASRPYPIFESSFSTYANLTVQDFNDESIQMYVQAQWKNVRLGIQASIPEALSNKVRTKAGGVFLWARLAIDELLQDLLRGKSIAALEAQLDDMPKEVEDMYQRILDRVPPIMVHETAMLLYMIMCSNQRAVQVQKLYIALDSQVRKHARSGVIQMLPIDLDDEEGLNSRISNVLGEFVDLDTYYDGYFYEFDEGDEERRIDYITSSVVIHKDELVVRRIPASGVSLTHETLRTFLDGNALLRSHIPTELVTIDPQHFWIHIYLDEMQAATSSGSDDFDKVRGAVHDFWQEIHVLPSNLQSSYENLCEIDGKDERLLIILRGWQTWTPLLLLGIQDLLEEVARCKDINAIEARKVNLILETQLMQYHLAICYFRHYSSAAAGPEGRYISPLPLHRCGYSCAYPTRYIYDGIMDDAISDIYDDIKHIGWDNYFSLCHDQPRLIAQSPIFDENKAETKNIQVLFNYVWKLDSSRKFSNVPCPSLMDRLISAGARLEGPQICSFFHYSDRHYGDYLPKLIQSHPGTMLSHANDCQLGQYRDSGSAFLKHWAEFDGNYTGATDTFEMTLKFILHCGGHINAKFRSEPLLNMLLASDARGLFSKRNRMKKCIIALRAGADPRLTGKDGNAIQAARALSSALKKFSKSLGLDDDEESHIGQRRREVTKIEEMLQECFEKGTLTESQLDSYARFNY